MQSNFERQSINFKRTYRAESMTRSRYVSEQYGQRAYPPLTQQDAAAQRRALTEEYLARRHKSEQLVQPEQHEAEVLMDLGNKDLPAYEKKANIQQAVLENQVTIVMGATGSGKSTQVPQFLLEAGLKPVMTQPRIMAANGVAERITDELAEHFGRDDAEALVGIHTSEQNTITEMTRISEVTDGLRLAQEFNRRGDIEDEVLIVDEVHEWNTNIEILLAQVKRLVAEKPHMRVVIMSATIDADGLVDYFSDVTETTPPVIEIEGRQHEVKFVEEPESTVASEAVKYAETAKSMLVFAPGKREVSDTLDEIARRLPPHLRDNALLLPLHAKMSKAEQDRVYQQVNGVKIIVATNVAQTSITIPGVEVVIDGGMERRIELDDEDIEGLMLRPSSRDDCTQKGGRTGRDVPGTWVLTRYNNEMPFLGLDERETHAPAEIFSTDLSRNVLRTAAHGIDFSELDLYHQVDQGAILRAKDTLYSLQAIDEDDQITSLGREMNKYSLSPRYGRMMVEATKDGMSKEIGAYMAAITASLEAGGLPYYAHDVETRWKTLLRPETDADTIAQLDLFIATLELDPSDETYGRQLADYDLDPKNVYRAQNTYGKICRIAGIDPHEKLQPPTPDEVEVLKDCIYTGMVESIYAKSGQSGKKATYLRMGPDEKMTQRTISNRSILSDEPELVAATPRRFERFNDGSIVMEHILENVTPGDRERLGRTAMHLCDMTSVGFVQRDGKVMQRQQQTLYGEKVGSMQEIAAEWSPQLREYIIKQALENPGPAQRELRAIKKELEELQQLTSEGLPVVRQEDLLSYLEAAAGTVATSPSQLDNLLGVMMRQSGLSLSGVLASERFKEIRENAPAFLNLQDGSLVSVKYQGERPPVVSLSDLLPHQDVSEDDLRLPDGRAVYVRLPKDSRGFRDVPFGEFKRITSR